MIKSLIINLLMAVVQSFLLYPSSSFSADIKNGANAVRVPASSKVSDSKPTVKRTKAIDFEDDVLEGMNRRSLDSLEMVGATSGKTQVHLYKRQMSRGKKGMSHDLEEALVHP